MFYFMLWTCSKPLCIDAMFCNALLNKNLLELFPGIPVLYMIYHCQYQVQPAPLTTCANALKRQTSIVEQNGGACKTAHIAK